MRKPPPNPINRLSNYKIILIGGSVRLFACLAVHGYSIGILNNTSVQLAFVPGHSWVIILAVCFGMGCRLMEIALGCDCAVVDVCSRAVCHLYSLLCYFLFEGKQADSFFLLFLQHR